MPDQLRNNLEYGRVGGESLRLDAYMPEGPGLFPAVIVVHGGGWVAGDRWLSVEPLLGSLIEGGFVCFSISYRLAKDISLFGAAVEDVEQAIRYVRTRGPQFKADRDRIALVGESAGGQLAAMAALGIQGAAIKAMVALYAPTDLEQIGRSSTFIPKPFRHAMLGTRLRALSPIHHVRRGTSAAVSADPRHGRRVSAI